MPIVHMTLKEGCDNEKIEKCMKNITAAIAGNLERTVPRMVRVTVMEIPEKYCLTGNITPEDYMPTLTFDIGPGRSEESVNKTMHAIVEAVSESLEIDKSQVRLYIIFTPNDNFTIAGKVK